MWPFGSDDEDETCDHEWEETGRTRRVPEMNDWRRKPFGWTLEDGGQPIIALNFEDQMREQCVHCDDKRWNTYQCRTAKWYPSTIEDGFTDGEPEIGGEDRR